MADQAVTESLGEDVEVEAKPRGGLTGKKLVIFIVLPIVLLLAAGAGVYFSGILGSDAEHVATDEAEAAPHEALGPTVYYDLPELLVNLNTAKRGSSYLKLSVSLELSSDSDKAALKNVLPRIVDNFQVYLRELRIEDLHGSAGLQRLREELLIRVNAATRPVVVRDVLFKEMLIQ